MSRVAANPHPAAVAVVVVLPLTPIRGAERDRGRLVEGRGVEGLLLVVFWVDALLTNRIRTTLEELMEEEDVGGSSITMAWDLMVAQPLQLNNDTPSSDMSPFLKQI